jgi:hypothetical protein
MAEKNLHQRILDDYLQQVGGFSSAADALSSFCVYATAWLKNAGIIGLGHTATGVSLRLRDGSEILLTGGEDLPLHNSPSVNITGNATQLQTTTPSRPADVAITGM